MSRFSIKFGNLNKKYLILGILAIFLLVGIVLSLRFIESYEFSGTEEEEVYIPSEDDDTLIYNGAEYTRNKDIVSVLVVGVDKYEGESAGLVKNSERADFILLLAIDTNSKTYKALHINRDSMANVPTLDIKGDPAGYEEMQITLAHTYGSGGKDSAENTVEAAENLLYGTSIDHYIVYKMDAVPLMADKLGGIVMTDGTVLYGADALSYVRQRDKSDAEGNLDRMARQREFLTAMKDQTQVAMADDPSFLADTILDFSQYMLSDLSIYQLNDYGDILIQAPDAEIKTIEGKTVIGDEYIEYYCDADSIKQRLVDMFYE